MPQFNEIKYQVFIPHLLIDISVKSNDTGSVELPDIVVCDPSPWDFDKIKSLNISVDMVSYIAHLLYTQSDGTEGAFKYIQDVLDKDYLKLLMAYDNNPKNLLNNITKTCTQLIRYCQLGTGITYYRQACCRELFTNVEYTLQYKCFSSGGNLNFSMLEATQINGITIGVDLSDIVTQLNPGIAGPWAVIMNGVAAAVTDKKSNLYYVVQTNLKLLEPKTYTVFSVERKETDNSDKSSDFKN